MYAQRWPAAENSKQASQQFANCLLRMMGWIGSFNQARRSIDARMTGRCGPTCRWVVESQQAASVIESLLKHWFLPGFSAATSVTVLRQLQLVTCYGVLTYGLSMPAGVDPSCRSASLRGTALALSRWSRRATPPWLQEIRPVRTDWIQNKFEAIFYLYKYT